MPAKRLLIVDDLHPLFKQEAEALGYKVSNEPSISREQALALITDCEGLAIRTKFKVDKEFIDAAPQLKWIARAGAGMDNVDEAYAQSKGITCINAPEGNADAVGEHTVGMLLTLLNKFRQADMQVRNGVWNREANRGWELKGRTVGIIGYGHMGQSFAQKLQGFGVQVIAYDKYKTDFSDAFAKEVSMEEIVKHSDVLSLHVPLTRETKYLVNQEYLFHFRKPIFLLNTSRGEVLDTLALLKTLKDGKVLGAGLDVLETEKFPALGEQTWYPELVAQPNVLLSPHVAGWTQESYRKISEVLAQKLKNLQI
ncbi:MAG: NAD(P)-dependent oxidoreductase [Sphingobacteriaceae bacterium]